MASDSITTKVIGQAKLEQRLQALRTHGIDLTIPMKRIGVKMISSVRRNFTEQGRPNKWKPSRRVLLKGGETLRLTGALMNRTAPRSFKDKLLLVNNLSYARKQQEGIGTIPRPFILFQEDDRDYILNTISNYMMSR